MKDPPPSGHSGPFRPRMSSLARSARRGLRAAGRLPGRAFRALLRGALPPTTSEILAADLERLSLPPGVFVHLQGSLGSLGSVAGGATAVIEAFREVVVARRGGTVAAPCFSLDGSMRDTLRAGRVFDVLETPSDVGAISEAFRRFPGVVRSLHPTHSVAALGPGAPRLVEGHHLCGSTFGTGSPYGKLLAERALLVGLGISIGPCTFFHVFEDITPAFPLPVYGAQGPHEALCRDYEGVLHKVLVRSHDPAVARTRIDKKAGAANRRYLTRFLEESGRLEWVSLGRARAWVIRTEDLIAALGELQACGITIYSTAEQLAGIRNFDAG